MARWKPIANLRSNIIHHPPVAVFFMCLLVLAGAFISIGIYSKSHDIRNPDISMDWNQMLSSLADLKFCTRLNDADVLKEKPAMNSPPLFDHAYEPVNSTQPKSVFLLVPLMNVGDYINHNSISATLLGSQLGLKGSSGKQSLNITLYLDASGTESSFIQKPSDKQAKPQSYESCLRITAPHHILPQTPLPPQCPSNKNPANEIPNTVKAHAIQSGLMSVNEPACVSFGFIPDPKLTVFLTQSRCSELLQEWTIITGTGREIRKPLCVIIVMAIHLTSAPTLLARFGSCPLPEDENTHQKLPFLTPLLRSSTNCTFQEWQECWECSIPLQGDFF